MRHSFALLAAFLACAVWPSPLLAQAGTIPPCETPRALPVYLSIWPPCPQPADTVFLRASSPCALCLDLQDIVFVPNRGWVVRSTSGPLEVCDVIDCIEEDVVMVPLGVFAAGHHQGVVTLDNVVTDPADGTSCRIVEQRTFSFVVGADCPPPDRCMWLTWGGAANACNAEVAPGRPATLHLGMRATEPVAGFQGKLFLQPYGLEITDVRAAGVASGMQVLWNRTSSGAFFVLYSETGQLLPPCNPLAACPACCIPSPVLEVTVAAKDGARPAPVTELLVWEVGGADSLGGEIRACVRDERDRQTMIARICLEAPCDANGDRLTDIRDLVTMVRCINDPEGCAADTAGTPLDCEGDGDLDLADVICCAHVILHGQLPDTAETVPAPEVYVRFGEPVRTAAGVDVPIAVHGGLRLSAARLGLSVPRDHFDVGGLDLVRAPGEWLALHEVGDQGVSLGFVRVGDAPLIPEDPGIVEAVLHLMLKPGGEVTGQLWLDDGDFTGAEGEGLIPGVSDRSVLLGTAGGVGRFGLAPPQPNPFTHETTFALALDRAAEVELTVHDLFGRRVVTLHAGRLAAGSHAFAWSGRGTDGDAPNGLYFVRARVDGRVLSQKVALLRGR